eukprot:4208995-Prymnesium_polylepis.2
MYWLGKVPQEQIRPTRTAVPSEQGEDEASEDDDDSDDDDYEPGDLVDDDEGSSIDGDELEEPDQTLPELHLRQEEAVEKLLEGMDKVKDAQKKLGESLPQN